MNANRPEQPSAPALARARRGKRLADGNTGEQVRGLGARWWAHLSDNARKQRGIESERVGRAVSGAPVVFAAAPIPSLPRTAALFGPFALRQKSEPIFRFCRASSSASRKIEAI